MPGLHTAKAARRASRGGLLVLWYHIPMTTMQLKKAERLAEASKRYAQKSLEKSRELEQYLSILDYKTGNVREFGSTHAITIAAKRA